MNNQLSWPPWTAGTKPRASEALPESPPTRGSQRKQQRQPSFRGAQCSTRNKAGTIDQSQTHNRSRTQPVENPKHDERRRDSQTLNRSRTQPGPADQGNADARANAETKKDGVCGRLGMPPTLHSQPPKATSQTALHLEGPQTCRLRPRPHKNHKPDAQTRVRAQPSGYAGKPA